MRERSLERKFYTCIQYKCLHYSTPGGIFNACVTSRLNYCNSIFAGSTGTFVRQLQTVLNAAARLIAVKKRSDHITPVLRDDLHWLPIRQRINYKIALMVYRCLHGLAPIYLSQSCIQVSSLSGRQNLRSAAHGDLFIPPTRTVRYGQRSFRSCEHLRGIHFQPAFGTPASQPDNSKRN